MTAPTGPEQLLTLAEYLAAAEVTVESVAPATPGAPVVTIGVPAGWQQMPAENFAGTYGVWAQAPENGWADNAVVLVARLSRPVDPETLLACGFTDARRLPEWTELDTHTGRFGGHPSAAITGTYTVAPLTLWAYNRYTLIDNETGSYLVQLTVTTRAEHDGSEAAEVVAGLTFA
ncbi:LpqN/LpqT family lipoprotein [Nocardia blacklockiae]|uniref:LpqN/LpqT family lipoprotein n=1 Tax=Nocardia blacklockiae TaxID=480036 RepID=UPI00189410E3|nr:LpqN/LpqT family lipoprotein [Nocardia blacklockiae]MBF6171264.1 LpqN/LpqT family lipoprotein [Nocardia blacklockiae]